MSYHLKHRRPGPLGNVVTDVLSAGSQVIQDPCLPQVAQQVLRLHELDQQPLNPFAPKPPPSPPTVGIGLCSAVKPLQLVVYAKERPWLVPVAIGGVMAILVGVGYMLGKGGGR